MEQGSSDDPQGAVRRALAAELQTLMNTGGLNQRDVAERSGVSANVVSRVLRGVGHPRIDTLMSLALVFDLDVFDLLERVRVRLHGPRISGRKTRLAIDFEVADEELAKVLEVFRQLRGAEREGGDVLVSAILHPPGKRPHGKR